VETFVFLGAGVAVLVVLLSRSRGGGITDYVPGSEQRDPRMIEDETNIQLAKFPGPGGPMDGTGGNVIGGG
jgi:hypothetical protein